MGFFSWITSDTKRSISNIYSGKGVFPVYVLVPKEFQNEYGKYIEEKYYEGYGDFGGRDIYALVARWNEPEMCKKDGKWLKDIEIRNIGIDIGCDDEQNRNLKYPIKIVENKELKYEDVEPSNAAPDQGFFWSEDELINCNDKSNEIDEMEEI